MKTLTLTCNICGAQSKHRYNGAQVWPHKPSDHLYTSNCCRGTRTGPAPKKAACDPEWAPRYEPMSPPWHSFDDGSATHGPERKGGRHEVHNVK